LSSDDKVEVVVVVEERIETVRVQDIVERKL